MERLAVRLALAARHPSDSLRPPPQRLAQVRQQERQDRCPKAGRAAASWDVKAGLPRSAQRAPVEGTQSQLSHSRTRQPPRDEPDQSDLPEPGDPLCRPAGLFAPLPCQLAGATARTRPTSASRITLSATRWSTDSAKASASRSTGREPQTSGPPASS